MTNRPTPHSPISARYLEHFSPKEFRFRWLEATGLDEGLPARANHLAARLTALFLDVYSVTTTYDDLARTTRMSLRTLQRALIDLKSSGWVVDSRRQSHIDITLILGDRGVDLLLAERERRRTFAGRRELNDQWTEHVVAQVLAAYGVPEIDTGKGKWRILNAKVRSIVAHMTCHEVEARKLIDELTEAPPTELRDLPGLLLSRAGVHVRNYPHLARSAQIVTPHPSGQEFIENVLEGLKASNHSFASAI